MLVATATCGKGARESLGGELAQSLERPSQFDLRSSEEPSERAKAKSTQRAGTCGSTRWTRTRQASKRRAAATPWRWVPTHAGAEQRRPLLLSLAHPPRRTSSSDTSSALLVALRSSTWSQLAARRVFQERDRARALLRLSRSYAPCCSAVARGPGWRHLQCQVPTRGEACVPGERPAATARARSYA